MATVSKKIGPISAYAIAKEEGYTGTKKEFAVDMGNSAANAQAAHNAAASAENSATEAAASADRAISTTPEGYADLIAIVHITSGSAQVGWESGGMYDATGIEYNSSTVSRTAFLSVTPGEKVRVVTDATFTNAPVFYYFASNEKTVSGTNERLGRAIWLYDTPWTVPDGAHYVRISISQPVANVNGRVCLVHADLADKTLAPVKSDLANIKNNAMFPITTEIGVNRFVLNGTYGENTSVARASTIPVDPKGMHSIRCIVEDGYTMVFNTRTNGAWTVNIQNITGTFDYTFTGNEDLFFVQILHDTAIPTDAVPVWFVSNVYTNLNHAMDTLDGRITTKVSTVRSEIDAVKADATFPIVVELWQNRAIVNGEYWEGPSEQKRRASTVPVDPKGIHVLHCTVETGYTMHFNTRTDGVWSQVMDITGTYDHTFTGNEDLFFVQILRDSDIPADAVPVVFSVKVYESLNHAVDSLTTKMDNIETSASKRDSLVELPIPVDIGLNRFVLDGTYDQKLNVSRASTPITSTDGLSNITCEIEPGYTVVLNTTDWSAWQSPVYDATETFTYDLTGSKAFFLQIKASETIPASAVPVRLFGNVIEKSAGYTDRKLSVQDAEVQQVEEDGRGFLHGVFVLGSIYRGDITPKTVYRAASETKFRFDHAVTLTPDAGFQFAIHTFSADGETFVSDSGFMTSAYTVPAETYFRIIIHEIGYGPKNGPANIERNVRAIKVSTGLSDTIDDISQQLGMSSEYVSWPLNIELWKNRALVNGEYWEGTSEQKRRASTAPAPVHGVSKVRFSVSTGCKINLFVRVNGQWHNGIFETATECEYTFTNEEYWFIQILNESDLPSGSVPVTAKAIKAPVLAGKADGIIESTSGKLVTIQDGVAGSALKGLWIRIKPNQSGSGFPSPDNVRTLSGRTGLTLYHSGPDRTAYTATTISWNDKAGTVYGGLLNVATGELISDMGFVRCGPDNISISTISLVGENAIRFWGWVGAQYRFHDIEAYCDKLDQRGMTRDLVLYTFGEDEEYPNSFYMQVPYGGTDGVQENTADSIKAWLRANEINFVVHLVSPTTYYIDQTELPTLTDGTNYIWTDGGEIKECDYLADTTARLKNVQKKAPWRVEMHRGYCPRTTIPQNTLPAIYEAAKLGADSVEIDARLTSDGVYILSHDPTVTVSGTTYTIAESTASVITNLVLKTDYEYGPVKIPTLEAALKLCLYYGIEPTIDFKSVNATTLAQLVVKTGLGGKCTYIPWVVSDARKVLAVDPKATLVSPVSAYDSFHAMFDEFPEAKQRAIFYNFPYQMTDELFYQLKSNGYRWMMSYQFGVRNMNVMDYGYMPDLVQFSDMVDGVLLSKGYAGSQEVI